jgi:hypothetical protein
MNEIPKIEVKNVKHIFSQEERAQIGADLARAIATARGVAAEFDQVQASFKSRTAAADAQIDGLATDTQNGFRYQNERCVVVYRPNDRKKDYFIERIYSEAANIAEQSASKIELPTPVLIEDMNAADFQAELIQAESKFDSREEIQLFQPTEVDRGVLVVGRFAKKWFSALRVTIGKLTLEERLDSEQRNFKARPDAVAHAVKRVREWAKENLKEHAEGFDDSFSAVVEAHKERAE